MGSICIQSLLQFSIVIGGAGVFLFAGPVEDEFTCYYWDLQHLNIITDFTHIYRESCVLLHEGMTYELSLFRCDLLSEVHSN